ncbi:DUF6314 family protein [Jannaschia pohangensis]|uniref:DUF6314 domain-containing protein n=1 Tax=Jannaschia pohangensis TaxID=390807 RepID=A0A1I3S9L5_9RHOB|nr:DUF6314 family protein [Jannaschia pohangensis]SFJ54227.1 hypothetical protein SAMN04488095_3034 [Jannaschia pohangensis]
MTMPPSAAACLAALRGEWRLVRVIRHVGGPTARFRGHATWGDGDGGLTCHEEGTLVIDGAAPVTATRMTLWRAEGEGIAVAFGDGRPFHVIDWTEGHRIQAAHDCPPDDYRLTYDFGVWPNWSVRWRVRGPRKDYRALSRYSRLSC